MSGDGHDTAPRDRPRIRLLSDARRDLVASCTFCLGRGVADDRERLETTLAVLRKMELPEREAALAAAGQAFLDSARAGEDPVAAIEALDAAMEAYWRAKPPRPTPGLRSRPAKKLPWWLNDGGDAA